MPALNVDLASVMQAGRRKTTVMPMRYGNGAQVGRVNKVSMYGLSSDGWLDWVTSILAG